MEAMNHLFSPKVEYCNDKVPIFIQQMQDYWEKQKTNQNLPEYTNFNGSNNQSKPTTVPNNSPVKVDSDMNRLMLDLCGSFEKIDCKSDDTSCDICSFKGQHKKSLKIHYMFVHGNNVQLSKGERTTQEVVCKYCEIKKQKIMSSIHYATKYKNIDHRCNICQYKTTNRFIIKAKRLADGSLKAKNSARYRCQFCYYKTIDSFSMEAHYKRKHNQESVAMRWTNYGIPVQKDNQKQTEKCDRNIWNYKCNLCSYKTEAKSLFRIHVRNHARGSKYLLDRTAEDFNELVGTFGKKLDIK